MTVDFNALGNQQLNELAGELREDGVLSESYTDQICVVPDTSVIKEKQGFAPILPAQMQTDSEDAKVEHGWNEDAEEMELEPSDRPYRIRRYARRIPYNENFEGSAIFDQVKETIVPTIERVNLKGVDRTVLAPIMRGEGTFDLKEKVARDVTKFTVPTGEQFTEDTADVLGQMQDAVDSTGADRLVLGKNVAQVLQSHPQIRDSIFQTEGGSGEVTKSRLAEFLEDHLGLDEVLIGKAGYQGGSRQFSLNVKFAFDDICFFYRHGNIVRLPWQSKSVQYHDYQHGPQKKMYVQGEWLHDIVVMDPAQAMAFKDVLSTD